MQHLLIPVDNHNTSNKTFVLSCSLTDPIDNRQFLSFSSLQIGTMWICHKIWLLASPREDATPSRCTFLFSAQQRQQLLSHEKDEKPDMHASAATRLRCFLPASITPIRDVYGIKAESR
ncbi:hypothetical protein PAHAL_9G190300 [Panicum hallii]|jgi:hypothetical protein|uniref:Uncharacterized protein n=1 Tax=Panicum hallii TaxID=206008 RepID=A0A2S3IKM4_9POAL|nr:hypothetical protein PAHAL_9G190300 [Panicum hallii]